MDTDVDYLVEQLKKAGFESPDAEAARKLAMVVANPIPMNAGQALRSGVRTFSASIPFSVLYGRFAVPYRDTVRKRGYQRKPQDYRVNQLVSALRQNRVDLPTAVLMNIRGRDESDRLVRDTGEGRAFLHVPPLPSDDNSGATFFVVDG